MMVTPAVVDDDLFVTLTDIAADRSYVYQAVSDVTSQDGSEITAEPGVAGRIGPDLPARMTLKVACITLDDGGVRLPVVSSGHVEMLHTDAVQQYQQLRLLKRRAIRIAARAVPDVQKVWAIESVHASDSLADSNHFDATVNLIEMIGGEAALSGAALALGSIVLPPPPRVDTTLDVNGDGTAKAGPNTPTGAGNKKCVPTFADEIVDDILGRGEYADFHKVISLGGAAKTVGGAVGHFFGWLGGQADRQVISPVAASKVGKFLGTPAGRLIVDMQTGKFAMDVAVASVDIASQTAETLVPRCTFS